MFEFGALGIVPIISPSSELGIMHHFFSWTPCYSKNILSKFQNYSQPARPIPKVSVWAEFIEACLNSEHSGLFQSYLPHLNSESCTVFFFYGLLILQRILYQNIKKFLNRLNLLASDSSDSSRQLVWSTNFGDFGAQFLHGLGP